MYIRRAAYESVDTEDSRLSTFQAALRKWPQNPAQCMSSPKGRWHPVDLPPWQENRVPCIIPAAFMIRATANNTVELDREVVRQCRMQLSQQWRRRIPSGKIKTDKSVSN